MVLSLVPLPYSGYLGATWSAQSRCLAGRLRSKASAWLLGRLWVRACSFVVSDSYCESGSYETPLADCSLFGLVNNLRALSFLSSNSLQGGESGEG